jgi:hypothetical protein
MYQRAPGHRLPVQPDMAERRMRSRRSVSFAMLALVFALAGCSDPTSTSDPLAADDPRLQVQQSWTPLEGEVFFNACTGEHVLFAEGSIQHALISVKSDGGGGYHVNFHRNGRHYNGPGVEWNGSSWVPTGTQYQGNSVASFHVNAKPPFPAEYTFTSNVRVISSGAAPNMMFHLVDHITVNANGEVTADVLDGWFTCI